jgi:hypothetical protein
MEIQFIKVLEKKESLGWIRLEGVDYFGVNPHTMDIEPMGTITGDYILANHIKCENFQVVFCPDTKETLLINKFF